MRIDNRTDWRTDQIRPILRRIARERLSLGAIKTIRATLYSKRRTPKGCSATIHRIARDAWVVRIGLPINEVPPADLALVFDTMISGKLSGMSGIMNEARRALWWSHYSWAIPLKIEKQPPPGSYVVMVKKLDAAWRSLKAAERKRKLYTTIAAKWKKKIQNLEKKLPKGGTDESNIRSVQDGNRHVVPSASVGD